MSYFLCYDVGSYEIVYVYYFEGIFNRWMIVKMMCGGILDVKLVDVEI